MPDQLERQLRTERLLLEPVRLTDAEDLYAIMREPALGVLTGDAPPEDAPAMRARIEGWLQGPTSDHERWLNWLARTGERIPVAHLSATVRSSTAWLAWIVALEQQRRGYATEAARGVADLLTANGVQTLAASIAEGHAASEGVARNLGMRLTDDVVDGERVWRTPPI